MSKQGTDACGRNEAQSLLLALAKLAAFVEAHPARVHLASRLWCYDRDEDISAECGFDVRDQTIGDVLHTLIRDDDNVERVLEERGLLVDLEA